MCNLTSYKITAVPLLQGATSKDVNAIYRTLLALIRLMYKKKGMHSLEASQ